MNTPQDRINDYWTGRAPAYDDYQQQPERLADDTAAWSAVWAEALGDQPLDVLDAGTGSGQVALVLAGLGHRVTGIDLSSGMLERARQHAAKASPAPAFVEGDAVAPDFPPASFDAITSRYLMWTLREPQIALANWTRLLRPGGIIAVVDSTWFPDTEPAFYDEEIRSELPLAGAKSIDETVLELANAGLIDVTAKPLTSIFALDQRYGVAPGHEVQMQFLVTGHAPS